MAQGRARFANLHSSTSLALAVSIFVLHCPGAWAGAWAVRPGSGSAVLTASHIGAQSVIDRKGDKHPFPIREQSLSTYGELGLTQALAAGWAWTAVKYRFTRAWLASVQFDSMFTMGQELPLGARFNAFIRFAWKG